jgi:hypothetical protein
VEAAFTRFIHHLLDSDSTIGKRYMRLTRTGDATILRSLSRIGIFIADRLFPSLSSTTT